MAANSNDDMVTPDSPSPWYNCAVWVAHLEEVVAKIIQNASSPESQEIMMVFTKISVVPDLDHLAQIMAGLEHPHITGAVGLTAIGG